MNKTLDFVSSTFLGGGISYFIGYIWFLLGEFNTINAIIMMLASLVWCAIAIMVALIGALIWSARHVRITVV